MIDINKVVVENFQDNIAYIEKEHPKTFTKLAALDSAIENNHYQERYELIYENNYFDVLEKSTQKLLYAQDSHIYSKLVADKIDFEKNIDSFKCFKKITISKDDRDDIKKDNSFENYLSKLVDILYYTQNNYIENKYLKSLDKFIFFGAGLGVHISEIHKKISSKSYLIVEDDLELFRLSLFVTNYKKLANQSKLYFSIFDKKSEFSEISKSFLNNEYYYNNYIKYFIMLSHSDEKRKLFHSEVISQNHLTYFYNTILTQSLKPLDYMFNEYKFLNKNISLSNKNLDKLSFLLLAAGPSLQKNREWLINNHKSFIIIAISAVLPFLEKENISPDIIIHLEGASHAINLFDNIKSFDFIKNSICIFSSRTPSNVMNLFQKKQIFLFENSTNYKENSLKLMSPCVGSASYQALILFQIKNIYLLGLDLAIDKSGKTHIDGHVRSKKLSTHKNNTMRYEKDLITIKGNLSEQTHTTMQYKASIDAIGYSCKLFKKKEQNIYNLGDGAYLECSIPTNANTINFSKEVKYDLYKLCEKENSKGLNKYEINSLNDKLIEARKIKQFIIDIKNKNNIQATDFLEDIKQLSLYISNNNISLKYELYNVLDNYLRHSLSLIFNFLNSNDFTIEKRNIHNTKLNTMLCDNILDIINYYTENIEKFTKREIK